MLMIATMTKVSNQGGTHIISEGCVRYMKYLISQNSTPRIDRPITLPTLLGVPNMQSSFFFPPFLLFL